ncbi:hypothetical protein RRG08_014217 [Elysia crispata]|uniref:Uncharacterized protein n=1 Tax=Elysia crispata TaxID=231223 RepID=A0AAE0XEX0_9GAST|nr:hypothetical protein RRG08_014217 [Elysia crispata]
MKSSYIWWCFWDLITKHNKQARKLAVGGFGSGLVVCRQIPPSAELLSLAPGLHHLRLPARSQGDTFTADV